MIKKGNLTVTITCCLSLLSHGLITTATGPLLLTLQHSFHVTSTLISLLYTFMSIGSITAVLISGYLLRILNFRYMALVAQLLMATSLMLFAVTKSIIPGIVLYAMLGLSGGLLQVSTNTAVSALNTDNRAPALNLLHFSFGLGALSGPLISGVILQNEMNWNNAYYFMAVYSVIVSMIYIFVRFPIIDSGNRKSNFNFLNYFKSSYFVIMILAIVIYVGVEMGINSWSVSYVNEKFILGNFAASTVLSYFWIFMTAGRLLCIPLTTRYNPALVMLVLLSFSVIAFIFYVFSNNVYLSFVSISVIGLCFSGVFPTLLSLAGNRYNKDIGSVTVVFMAFSNLGIMLFPLLMGSIKDSFSLSAGMKMLVLFDIFLAMTMLWIYSKSRTSPEKMN